MPHVVQIESKAEFDEFIKNSAVAIDFYADWCGPCKMISPFFAELSDKYPDVKFGKVNVDDASEVAEECGISAMPTFFFYKNGTKLPEDLKGASKEKLEEFVSKLAA